MSDKDIESQIKIIEDDTEKGETRGRKKKNENKATSSGSFSKADLQQTINLIFSIPYLVLKRDYPYTDDDFKIEAEALQRICNKFPPVKEILKFFDIPIIAVSLIKKWTAK